MRDSDGIGIWDRHMGDAICLRLNWLCWGGVLAGGWIVCGCVRGLRFAATRLFGGGVWGGAP